MGTAASYRWRAYITPMYGMERRRSYNDTDLCAGKQPKERSDSVGKGVIAFRNFMRNTDLVWFKLYQGQEEIIDPYGNPTGSFAPEYGELQSARLCVSPNKGSSAADMFGSMEDYDRTMSTARVDCAIDENAILWLDGADTAGAHNYIVKRKSRWKNSVSYAVKKITVSGGDISGP